MTKIDELKALMAQATPGPWYLLDSPIQISDSDSHTNKAAIVHWTGFDSGDRSRKNKLKNARLIIEAHNALPALIDAAAALNKSREDINWMLNNRQFLNAETFDYIDAALAKFGE